MKKAEIKRIDVKLEREQKAVAKNRDNLDELINEVSMLRESCDRAWDALQSARDALSELV
jgi:chromosome segregation ATPase